MAAQITIPFDSAMPTRAKTMPAMASTHRTRERNRVAFLFLEE